MAHEVIIGLNKLEILSLHAQRAMEISAHQQCDGIIRDIRRCIITMKLAWMQEQKRQHLFVLAICSLIPVAFFFGAAAAGFYRNG